MDIYRVFLWDGKSQGAKFGGPLYVPRAKQGAGRHDIPERDGVLYCSQMAVSAVVETIKSFRGLTITNDIFDRPNGLRVALVHLRLHDNIGLLDLDDPNQLASRQLIPSLVVSSHRQITQDMTRKLYDEGLAGFTWWSTLDSSWKNVTLFESRVRSSLQLAGDIVALHLNIYEVQQAAKHLHMRFKEKRYLK